jgi:putative membrane protein
VTILFNHLGWIKAFHVVAVIAWMAGMLYLPRLFVYHCEAPAGSAQSEMLKVMEHRLLRIIINPAMVLTFIFGLALIYVDGSQRLGWGFIAKPWMLTKLAGVVFLAVWHGYLAGARKAFARGERPRSARFWRMTNELPFLAAIVMVLAVTTEFGG